MRRSHLAAVVVALVLWACTSPLPTSPDLASVAGGGVSAAGQDAVSTSGLAFCDRKDNNKPIVDDKKDKQNNHDDDCDGKGDGRDDKGRDDDRRSMLHRSDRHDDKHGKKDRDDDGQCTSGGSGGTGGGVTPGSIAGGVTDEAGPIAGWSIYLIASNGTVTTTQTNASGAYSFTNLQPGTYRVCEASPSPAFEAVPGAAATNSTPCASPYAPFGYSLTVTSGASLSGNNFQNAAAS